SRRTAAYGVRAAAADRAARSSQHRLGAHARLRAQDLAARRRADDGFREAVGRRVAREEVLEHAAEQEGAGALETELVDGGRDLDAAAEGERAGEGQAA